MPSSNGITSSISQAPPSENKESVGNVLSFQLNERQPEAFVIYEPIVLIQNFGITSKTLS